MRMGRAWLVLVAAAAALATRHGEALSLADDDTDDDFSYGFSECVDNKRTLYYYTDEELTCKDSKTLISKPPVHGLRCDIVCDKGYFLGANFSGDEPVSGCEKCPQGQYSLGGGKLFSQRTKAFTTPLPIDIHSDCVTRNLYTSEWQPNCRPWRATHDGSMLESGDNSDILEQFEAGRLFSSLRISATFVRNGSVTFKYRVSAEPPYDGLVFGVDEQTVMELVSRTSGWEEAVFDVPAGAHTFTWDYTKDFSGDGGEDKAYIKVIELVGTAFSDTHCHPCGGDATMTGGSLCAFCKANEYAAPRSDSELDFACYACPANTFAPKGSIGLEACVSKRPCTSDDVVEELTPCVKGRRNVTFSWSEPRTCDLELPGASHLPKPKVHVECDACERGYRVDEQGECVKCPQGQRLDSDGKCAQCPVGLVAVNLASYGRGTTTGWSEWPSIVDVAAAQQNGWKLMRDGLVFSPDSLPPSVLAEATRFPLPFNVTFVTKGSMELMYVLQNVPTFENDGVRAWLEIEAEDADAVAPMKREATTGSSHDSEEDDDTTVDVDGDGVGERVIHLANGGSNGTSQEGFDFDAINGEPTTTFFRLVLRTSSPKAARMVQAKLFFLRFEGVAEGAGVNCASCAEGFQAVHSSEFNGCKKCPAGTYAGKVRGVTVCEKCPVNTWSRDGAIECQACANNTVSDEGAARCSPPTTIRVRANGTTGAKAANYSYNIELLQSMVWGNLSSIVDGEADDEVDEALAEAATGGAEWAAGRVESGPVTPAHVLRVDAATSVITGLFRPVSSKWKTALGGHVQQDLTSEEAAQRPYVVLLSVLNAKDAGGSFKQTTSRYGAVQCSVPAQWKVTSGGNRLAIEPSANGTGLTVQYLDGSPCHNGRAATTTINYVCDLKSGSSDRPTRIKYNANTCHLAIEWRTAFACPICDPSYFTEAKSTCADGQQSVSFARLAPCYGGYDPASVGVKVTTCSQDLVLDSQALYTAYAAISVVAFVILLLMAGILVIHRKYRNAYNDYLYLKSKAPVNEVVSKDGTNEATFEFTPSSTAIHSSSPGSMGSSSLFSPTEDEEKDDEKNVRVNSV